MTLSAASHRPHLALIAAFTAPRKPLSCATCDTLLEPDQCIGTLHIRTGIDGAFRACGPVTTNERRAS